MSGLRVNQELAGNSRREAPLKPNKGLQLAKTMPSEQFTLTRVLYAAKAGLEYLENVCSFYPVPRTELSARGQSPGCRGSWL
jgi:hypothetical protein